jgi:K+-transporting ATPase KdpF subunit
MHESRPASINGILHPLRRFYTANGKFCPVFPPRPLLSGSESLPRGDVRICNSRSGHGSRVYGCNHRFFIADAGFGRGLRGTGKKEVTWAYVLSGLVSLALLVYLLIALIFAEDL